jgi:hypothetical protein
MRRNVSRVVVRERPLNVPAVVESQRMLQEESGSTQPSVSSQLAPAPDCCEIPNKLEPDSPLYASGALTDELIAKCCGSHSLGLVYWFLRKAGMDNGEARVEFELYMSGALSEKLLDIAVRWIRAEQGKANSSVA